MTRFAVARQIHTTYRSRHLGYVDAALKLRCAPDLLAVGWGGAPAKELSESMAVRFAMLRHRPDWAAMNDYDVHCLCVGDGSTPRTGALMALTTAWQVHSVDPRCSGKRSKHIDRLTVHSCRLEDAELPQAPTWVVMAVHSHAPWEAVTEALRFAGARRAFMVALPCCVPHPEEMRGWKRVDEYDDEHCLSPERRVIVSTFDRLDWQAESMGAA